MNVVTTLSADQITNLKALGWSYGMLAPDEIGWWRINYDIMVDGQPTINYPGSSRWILDLASLIGRADESVTVDRRRGLDPIVEKLDGATGIPIVDRIPKEEKNPKDIGALEKVPMWSLPAIGAVHGAQATGDGIRKGYGPYNWRDKPISLMEHLGALEHLGACIKDGEDYCVDSKVSHLGCINAGTAIILDAKQCGTLIDDRPERLGHAAQELEEYRANFKNG